MTRVPIRLAPYAIDEQTDYGCILFRQVFNDVRVSDWQDIPDLHSVTIADLRAYLTNIYQHDPELRGGTTWCRKIIEDKHGNQYWGVLSEER